MGASKLLHRILKFIMQIYANLFKINKKCYFSISWPILILFVLSDWACSPWPTGIFLNPSWGYDDIYIFGSVLVHLSK